MEMQNDILRAVEVLKKGGIILYPTDTIWGIGCDATNDGAVERIFSLKERPDAKAMISLVDSMESLAINVENLPVEALEEIQTSTRPLTIIYDKPRGISTHLIADDGSAAFRIVGLEFTKDICRGLGVPLVSTSANKSGKPASSTFDEIPPEIKNGVDYICNFGRNLFPSAPSRIVKISDEGAKTVIRE